MMQGKKDSQIQANAHICGSSLAKMINDMEGMVIIAVPPCFFPHPSLTIPADAIISLGALPATCIIFPIYCLGDQTIAIPASCVGADRLTVRPCHAFS